jgi:hypothetical protein
MRRLFPTFALACPALVLSGLLLMRTTAPAGAAQGEPPRTVTIKGRDIPLEKALGDVARQSGIPVHDRRDLPGTKSKVTLELDRATFWEAVDAIAAQLHAGVSVYHPDGIVALVRPAPRLAAVSHAGILRGAVKRLAFTRDLETGTHSGVVHVEIAWEPGFRPLLLESKSYAATFAPGSDRQAFRVKRPGTGQTAVQGPAAVVELPLAAPDRSSPALAELQANFAVVGSAKMLAARFDRLGQAAKGGKPQAQTPEPGVTVTLRKLDVVDTDRWEVEIGLSYPPDGPVFESYQDWLVNNRIYLEKGKGGRKQRFDLRPADQRILQRQYPRAVIQYQFVERPGQPRLGNPGDWTLVYETPGRFVTVPATFTFKNLPLP